METLKYKDTVTFCATPTMIKKISFLKTRRGTHWNKIGNLGTYIFIVGTVHDMLAFLAQFQLHINIAYIVLDFQLYITATYRLSLDVDVYAALLVYNRFSSNASGVGGGSCDKQVRTLYARLYVCVSFSVYTLRIYSSIGEQPMYNLTFSPNSCAINIQSMNSVSAFSENAIAFNATESRFAVCMENSQKCHIHIGK